MTETERDDVEVSAVPICRAEEARGCAAHERSVHGGRQESVIEMSRGGEGRRCGQGRRLL